MFYRKKSSKKINVKLSNIENGYITVTLERKLDINGTEKNNLRILKNIALSASYNFSAKELLSEFYVAKYMNGEFAKKLETDYYLNSCAKIALQAYYNYHKQ